MGRLETPGRPGVLGRPGMLGGPGMLGALGELGTPGTVGTVGTVGRPGVLGELPPWVSVTETRDGRGLGRCGVPSGAIVTLPNSGFDPELVVSPIPRGELGRLGVPGWEEADRHETLVCGAEDAFAG